MKHLWLVSRCGAQRVFIKEEEEAEEEEEEEEEESNGEKKSVSGAVC